MNLKGRISPQEYAEILFNDLGFAPSARRAFLAARFSGRKFLDELAPGTELSPLIDELRARKQALADRQMQRRQGAADQESFSC